VFNYTFISPIQSAIDNATSEHLACAKGTLKSCEVVFVLDTGKGSYACKVC